MAVRKVLRMGDPALLQQCKDVTEFDTPELHGIISDMRDTMKAEQGAGLAAIQINIPLNIAIFGFEHNPRYPDAEPVQETILINPKIEILDQEMDEAWEGCLSIPGMRGLVPRYTHIKYSGFDPYGERIERVAEGFHARVVQHECDHLLGILYIHRVKDLKNFGFIEELQNSGRIETPLPCETNCK